MKPAEEKFLARILANEIRLDDHNNLWYYHATRKTWYQKKLNKHPLTGRTRFQYDTNRTTIYFNRAVWMIHHRKPIPDGYHIDHIDGNLHNNDPSNLQLHSSSESHAQGNGVQTDHAVEALGRWFQFMAWNGREPYHPYEISWVEEGF